MSDFENPNGWESDWQEVIGGEIVKPEQGCGVISSGSSLYFSKVCPEVRMSHHQGSGWFDRRLVHRRAEPHRYKQGMVLLFFMPFIGLSRVPVLLWHWETHLIIDMNYYKYRLSQFRVPSTLVLFCAVLGWNGQTLTWWASILPLSDIPDPFTHQRSCTSVKPHCFPVPQCCAGFCLEGCWLEQAFNLSSLRPLRLCERTRLGWETDRAGWKSLEVREASLHVWLSLMLPLPSCVSVGISLRPLSAHLLIHKGDNEGVHISRVLTWMELVRADPVAESRNCVYWICQTVTLRTLAGGSRSVERKGVYTEPFLKGGGWLLSNHSSRASLS